MGDDSNEDQSNTETDGYHEFNGVDDEVDATTDTGAGENAGVDNQIDPEGGVEPDDGPSQADTDGGVDSDDGGEQADSSSDDDPGVEAVDEDVEGPLDAEPLPVEDLPDQFVTDVEVDTDEKVPTETRLLDTASQIQSGFADRVMETITRRQYEDRKSGINQYAYERFSGYFRDHHDRFESYRDQVNKARLDETYDLYLARMVLVAILMFGVGLVVGLSGGFIALRFGYLAGLPGIDVLWVVLFAVLSGLAFGAGLVLWFYYTPIYVASGRARRINFILPSAITFMYAQSKGGLPIVNIADRLAREEQTYGEVAREFQMIMNDMEYLGDDFRSALTEGREKTPSQEFAELLDDLISVLNTRGDIEPFLANKIDQYHERAREERKKLIERVEKAVLSYTVFTAVGILGGATAVTVMLSMSGQGLYLLAGIAYGFPLLAGLSIATFLSIFMEDWSGDLYDLETSVSRPSLESLEARLDGREVASDGGLEEAGPLSPRDERGYKQLIRSRRREKFLEQIMNPLRDLYFYPTKTLIFTVPAALVLVCGMILSGLVEPSVEGFIAAPYQTTNRLIVYPLTIVFIPLGTYSVIGIRRQDTVSAELPEVLRKLASANDTGMTLANSIELVSESTAEVLAEELNGVQQEIRFNVSLNDALIRFANRVRNPRVTKVMKILVEANTSSGDIREVLKVAERDAKERWRNERTRRRTMSNYLVIMALGYLALVVTLWALNSQVLPQMAAVAEAAPEGGELEGAGFALTQGVPADTIRVMFYHAAVIQAIVTGLIAGKTSRNSYASGGLLCVFQMFVAVILMPLPFPI